MSKPMVLRAFSINQVAGVTEGANGILKTLAEKITDKVYDRKMVLSQTDPESQIEFMSYYEPSDNSVFGIIMRMNIGGNASFIDEELFNKPNFTMNDLHHAQTDYSGLYKNHYYFYMNDNKLITNLSRNTSINRFQIYITWLLDPVFYEFTPVISDELGAALKDLKEITFSDAKARSKVYGSSDEQIETKSVSVTAMDYVKRFLSDTNNLSDHDLAQIISAKLFVTFKKPRKMSEEEYQTIFGAFFKPMSDTENIQIKTKKGNRLKGDQCLREKQIDIETTDNGKYIDQGVKQEMAKFMGELNEGAHI